MTCGSESKNTKTQKVEKKAERTESCVNGYDEERMVGKTKRTTVVANHCSAGSGNQEPNEAWYKEEE